MGKGIAAAVLAVAMFGCASKRPAYLPQNESLTQHGVMLIGRSGLAQGCPVGERVMLTARHVAMQQREWGEEPVTLMWSDNGGQAGRVVYKSDDAGRDIAVMTSDRPFRHWYVPSSVEPEVGSSVEIRGYNFNRSMYPATETVEVENVVAAHLVLSPGGRPGFSGSCVVDEAGRVVGIFVAGVPNEMGVMSGLAVGVWGELSPVKP